MGDRSKFDMQLAEAIINERKLYEIFTAKKIEKVELKSESYLWELSGNICIEISQRGKPSGIMITEADYWVHELKRDGKTLCYLMFPIERLKELVAEYDAKGWRRRGGDNKEFEMVLVPIWAAVLR